MAEVTLEPRIRFRDLKPYYAPEFLETLRGPYHGRIDLSHRVRWQADCREVDIDDPGGGRRIAYQALLAEGRADDQERLLNRRRLVEMWPLLNLDRRVLDLWEGRFPELKDA